ncbi:MAG: hypothetical protein H0W62_14880 [Chitinophagales bacterium]|nr:hypothetical protein [Chitinophagales bacterium]
MRWITPLSFAASVLCFFMPFIKAGCTDRELGKLSGIELITELKSTTDKTFPPSNNENIAGGTIHVIERNYFALVAIMLAIGGFILFFLLKEQKDMLLSIIGLAGLMCLLLMRIQMDNSSSKFFSGMNCAIMLNYTYGYWFTTILFASIGTIHMNAFIQSQKVTDEILTDQS